jgi:hypothetical protein
MTGCDSVPASNKNLHTITSDSDLAAKETYPKCTSVSFHGNAAGTAVKNVTNLPYTPGQKTQEYVGILGRSRFEFSVSSWVLWKLFSIPSHPAVFLKFTAAAKAVALKKNVSLDKRDSRSSVIYSATHSRLRNFDSR